MKKFADYIKEDHKTSIDWPSIKGRDLMSFYSAMKSTKIERLRLLDEEFKREMSEKIESFFQENNVEIDEVKVYGGEFTGPNFDFSIHFKSGEESLFLAKQNGLFSEYKLYMERGSDTGRFDYLKSYSNLKDFFEDYQKERLNKP